MFDRTDKLVEATMLALQGKLELKENKKSNKRAKTKKFESIDVNVDETTAVSVDNGTTVVETEDATIMITEPEKQPEESIEAPADLPIETPETVEVPTDDTIMPEEILDEPVDTELPEETEPTIDDIVNDDVPVDDKEENKKVTEANELKFDILEDREKEIAHKDLDMIKGDIDDNMIRPATIKSAEALLSNLKYWFEEANPDYKTIKENVDIEISDDGKEVEVTTDDGEEVEVKDDTPDETDDEEEISVPEDGNENIDGEEIIDDEVDECKKITEDVTNYNGAYGYFADVIKEVAQNIDNLNKDTKYQDAIADDKKLELVIDSIMDDDELWNTLQETIVYYIDELIAGNLNESKKVEDTDYALEPRYASTKSFYGKARVRQKDNGDEELYSYGTHVGGMRNGKPYSKGKFSSTTSRHQAEYFKQKGVDPKKVDVEEGKDCKECDKKLEAFKIKSRAERRAKLEARRAKKTENINDDLGIEEGVPKKEEIVPNAQKTTVKNGKVSSKSFTEALTKFFKENYKTIKEVNVSKISQNKSGDLKIEAVIKNLGNKTKDICLEMTKVQSGKSFNKYTLKEAKGLIKESKNDNKKITMMTFNNKNIMECRYLLKK